MKTLFICLITLLLYTSCSQDVQVLSVRSDILQNDTLLRYENDTLEIIYNLYDNGGSLTFSIYNKSAVPLYIDWKRSALIKGTQKQDYWNSEIKVKTRTKGYSIEWIEGYTRNRNSSTGVMIQEEQISFIPPKTAITMSKFKISGPINTTDLTEKKVAKTYKKGTTSIFTKQFDIANTPLIFRNFLTLSLKHDFSEEFYIDQSFWVDGVTKMDSKQFRGMMFTVVDKDDRFNQYTDFEYPYRKPNNFYNVVTAE